MKVDRMNILLSFRVVSDENYPKSIKDVVYPQSINWRYLNQLQVLGKVLESYNILKFEKAFIFVDIEDNTSDEVELINNLIMKNIRASSLKISYERPKSKHDWLQMLTKIEERAEPYLISMSHDMEFIGVPDQLMTLVNKYYNELKCKGKMLTYAHVPEYLAIAKMNIFGYDFQKRGLCYVDNGPRKWVDCVFIMSLNTLYNIFSEIKGEGPDYLPRIDWPTAEFGSIDVQTMVYPIELFRHYDGSTHVVCSRLLERFEPIMKDNRVDYGTELFVRFVQLYHIFWAKRLAILRLGMPGRNMFGKIYSETADEFIASIKEISNLDLLNSDVDIFYRCVAYYQDICYQDSLMDSKTIDKKKLPRSFSKVRAMLRKMLK